MHRSPIVMLAIASISLFPVAGCAEPTPPPAATAERSAAEVLRSVFGNRISGGGFWRQDNPEFVAGGEAPKYWMQVWRSDPGEDKVFVDAYEVKEDDGCSALFHIVYSYDSVSKQIVSQGSGANGISGQGVVEFDGTATSTETTVRLPDGNEVRIRDRQDHGAGDAIEVSAERWDGEAWEPTSPATWRRSAQGPPCG